MVEDEDSKARRNFMAVSTVIVLAWWLQAPLDKISERLLGSSVGPGFEWRAWFAAIVALVYFALRFRFSTEHIGAATELATTSVNTSTRLLLQWLHWETAALVRWGWAPSVCGDAIEAVVSQDRASADGETFIFKTIVISDLTLGRKDGTGQIIPLSAADLSCTARFVIHRVGLQDSGVWLNSAARFELSKSQHRLLRLWSWAWMMLYSKVSIAFFVPWLVGCIALCICVVRLVRTF